MNEQKEQRAADESRKYFMEYLLNGSVSLVISEWDKKAARIAALEEGLADVDSLVKITRLEQRIAELGEANSRLHLELLDERARVAELEQLHLERTKLTERVIRERDELKASAEPKERQPDGYAYRYPTPWPGRTAISFERSNARDALEVIPYYFGKPAGETNKAPLKPVCACGAVGSDHFPSEDCGPLVTDKGAATPTVWQCKCNMSDCVYCHPENSKGAAQS